LTAALITEFAGTRDLQRLRRRVPQPPLTRKSTSKGRGTGRAPPRFSCVPCRLVWLMYFAKMANIKIALGF